jgi:hypothetical protein
MLLRSTDSTQNDPESLSTITPTILSPILNKEVTTIRNMYPIVRLFTLNVNNSPYLTDHFIKLNVVQFPISGYISMIHEMCSIYHPITITNLKINECIFSLHNDSIIFEANVNNNNNISFKNDGIVVATATITENMVSIDNVSLFIPELPISDQIDMSTFYEMFTKYKPHFTGLEKIFISDRVNSIYAQISSNQIAVLFESIFQLSNLIESNTSITEVKSIQLPKNIPESITVLFTSSKNDMGVVTNKGIAINGINIKCQVIGRQLEEKISITYEDYLICGRNTFDINDTNPNSLYLSELLKYSQNSFDNPQLCDTNILESTPNNYCYQFLKAQKESTPSLFLGDITADSALFNLNYIDKCLDVVRMHSKNNLIALYEPNSSLFFEMIASFLHPLDTIQKKITPDCNVVVYHCQLKNKPIQILSDMIHILTPGTFVLISEITDSHLFCEDKKDDGNIRTPEDWLYQLEHLELNVISYYVSNISVTFFARKKTNLKEYTIHRAPTRKELPIISKDPILYLIHDKDEIGTHGCVKSLVIESYPCISFEYPFTDEDILETIANKHHIDESFLTELLKTKSEGVYSNVNCMQKAMQYGLSNNVVIDHKLMIPVHCHFLSNLTSSRRVKGAHLIAGGLGKLGMYLAEWLVNQGATKLVLVTRRGIMSGQQKLFLQKIKAIVIICDLTNDVDTNNLFLEYGPFNGVWHTATLPDKNINIIDMTVDKWATLIRTKIKIVDNLNHNSQNKECEYFVCLSSILSRFGSKGESHHCFANKYIEHTCQLRRENGYSGTAIQLGPIFFDKKKNTNEKSYFINQNVKSLLSYLDPELLKTKTIISICKLNYPVSVDMNYSIQSKGDSLSSSENESMIFSEEKASTIIPSSTVSNTSSSVSDLSVSYTSVSDVNPNVSDTSVSDVNPSVSDVNPSVSDVNPNVSDVNPNVSDTSVSDVNPNVSDTSSNVSNVSVKLSSPKRKYDKIETVILIKYVPSLLHSILAVILTLLATLKIIDHQIVLYVSFIYLIIDFSLNTKMIFSDKSSLSHHLIFLTIIILNYLNQIESDIAVTVKTIGLYEVSTIFLDLYHIYRREWMRPCFIISFIVCRIFIGTFIVLPSVPMLTRQRRYLTSLLPICLYLIQVYWVYCMYKIKRRETQHKIKNV